MAAPPEVPLMILGSSPWRLGARGDLGRSGPLGIPQNALGLWVMMVMEIHEVDDNNGDFYGDSW